jgi:hypothetical protein
MELRPKQPLICDDTQIDIKRAIMDEPADNNTQNLLHVWMTNSKRAMIAHYESANWFSRLNYFFGIPVVALSTIVGTSVFATLQKQVAPSIQLAVGMISVLAAVLASLQTFLRFSDRSTKHHAAASDYESVKRQIQEAVVNRDTNTQSGANILTQVRERMDVLGKNAPSIPKKVWDSACKNVPFTKNALNYEANREG